VFVAPWWWLERCARTFHGLLISPIYFSWLVFVTGPRSEHCVGTSTERRQCSPLDHPSYVILGNFQFWKLSRTGMPPILSGSPGYRAGLYRDRSIPSSSSQLTQYQLAGRTRYPKTERYCLSSLCFEMTRHARSRRQAKSIELERYRWTPYFTYKGSAKKWSLRVDYQYLRDRLYKS
jgi:hypothetical protein